MHFGGNATRKSSRSLVRGPEQLVGVALMQIFGDGEAVPNPAIAVVEYRLLSVRRIFGDLLCGIGLPQGDQCFLEGNSRHAHEDPWPQAPRGPFLAADDQSIHFRLLEGAQQYTRGGPLRRNDERLLWEAGRS